MAATRHAKGATATGLGWLLDAGDGAIVTLVAADTRLLAHRAVLVDRSPVFEAMFRHDMWEVSSGSVAIPDVEGPVLRQLLEYLYTLQAPQLPSMAPQLLAAADKYGVSALKNVCEQQVAVQQCVETAAAAAVLAIRHSCSSLRQSAIDFTIKSHLVQVMATEGWAHAVHTQHEDVVELSRLLSETIAPPPEDSGSCPSPSAQMPSDHSETPVSATPAMAASSLATPPDDDAVSRLASLSREEKARRVIEAARDGALGELEALLVAGADVGARDGHVVRRTALQWAAWGGHVEVARQLLAAGAAVGPRSGWRQTPLQWAAMEGHVAVVRQLLDNGANHGDRDLRGRTSLHWAAYNGHSEVVAALLEAGASRGIGDIGEQTPLELAKRNNHQQVVDLLLGR